MLAFAAAALAVAGLGSPGAACRLPPAADAVAGGLAGSGRAAGGRRAICERRIAAAGRPGGLGASEVMAAKLACAVAAGAVGLAAGAVAPGRLGLLVVAAAPVAGFLAPDCG